MGVVQMGAMCSGVLVVEGGRRHRGPLGAPKGDEDHTGEDPSWRSPRVRLGYHALSLPERDGMRAF